MASVQDIDLPMTPPAHRSPSKNLSIQVAVLSQRLEQSEQLVEELRRREEASKKAYAMLLNTFNDIRGSESLRDEILLLKSCKEHDTYMLRNQCTEILNLVQSSMKKGSYNYPTSRYASVSRDPQRYEEKQRELGEALSVRKFVLEGQDEEFLAKGDGFGLNLARKPSDCTSQRDISQLGEVSENPFLTHRSRIEQEQEAHKIPENFRTEYTQLEKVKQELLKKSNKIDKLRKELVYKDSVIESLKLKVRELTQGLHADEIRELKFERPRIREVERIQTLIVNGVTSKREESYGERKEVHGSVVMVFPHIAVPEFKMHAMPELKKNSTIELQVSEDSSLTYGISAKLPLKTEDDQHCREEQRIEELKEESSSSQNSACSENDSQSENKRRITTSQVHQTGEAGRAVNYCQDGQTLVNSRSTQQPLLRKTSSYNYMQGASMMSSNYNLRREDSRDTLRGDSVRSNEVDRLMRENKRVTKDLRNMFAQYESVEGIYPEDVSPAMRSARKAVKAGDGYIESRQDVPDRSGEKRGWQSGRKAQNLMLQEFMANGILETRAEDNQDDSDVHIKVKSGSALISKGNSRGGSPHLGARALDRLLQKQPSNSFEKNNQNTENNSETSQVRQSRADPSDFKEGPRTKPQIPILDISGTKPAPKSALNYDLDVANYEKSMNEDNSQMLLYGAVQVRVDQRRADQTANIESIRALDTCSDNGSMTGRLSVHESIEGNTKRRLHGFVDTFKEPDAEVEDIRSDDETQRDRDEDQRELKKVMEATQAAELKNMNMGVYTGMYSDHQELTDRDLNSIPTKQLIVPLFDHELSSRASKSVQGITGQINIVEPSLNSEVRSSCQMADGEKKLCSPRRESHNSNSGSESPHIHYKDLSIYAGHTSVSEEPQELLREKEEGHSTRPGEVGRLDLSRLKYQTETYEDCQLGEELVHIGSKSVSDVSNNLSAVRNHRLPQMTKKKIVEEPWMVAGRGGEAPIEMKGPHDPSDSHIEINLKGDMNKITWESKLIQRTMEDKVKQFSQDNNSGLWMWDHGASNVEKEPLNFPDCYKSHHPDISQGRKKAQPILQNLNSGSSRKLDRQRRLHWQASGVSIREITASPGVSAKKIPREALDISNRFESRDFYADGQFVIHRQDRHLRDASHLQSGLAESQVKHERRAVVEGGKREVLAGERREGQKTSYRNLLHLLDNRRNTPESSVGPRSRSRKAHSAINQPQNGCDESDCKSIKSNITGFKKDSHILTTNEKKHMRFKTDYCGLIKHIAINLVEESGSTSNSFSPEYDAHILKKTAAFLPADPSKISNDKKERGESKIESSMRQKAESKPEGWKKNQALNRSALNHGNSRSPSATASNVKRDISGRRMSNICQAILKESESKDSRMKPVDQKTHNRRVSQQSVLAKPAATLHSRRHSAIGLTNGTKQNSKKPGLGEKAKLYANKITVQPGRDLLMDKENSVNETAPIHLGADLYMSKREEVKAKHQKDMDRQVRPTNGSINSKAQGEYLIASTISNKSRQARADGCFLGVKINEVQNLYSQENGGCSQVNTERSNNYVLKCRGSPLSNCKYTDVSRNSESNLYGIKNGSLQKNTSSILESSTRKFGRPVQNSSALNSSSCGLIDRSNNGASGLQVISNKLDSPQTKGKEKERVSHLSRMNETAYSAHDSIVMMHEILVDKVSDLHQKFIVHEQSSSKKHRSNTKSRLQESAADEVRPRKLL